MGIKKGWEDFEQSSNNYLRRKQWVSIATLFKACGTVTEGCFFFLIMDARNCLNRPCVKHTARQLMRAGVQQFVVRPQAFAPRCQRSRRLFDKDQNRQAASVTSSGYSLNSVQVTIKPQVKARKLRRMALSCIFLPPPFGKPWFDTTTFLKHCMLIYSFMWY